MKFAKYFLIGFIGVSSLTSCVDYLDKEPDTELSLPMVFEDKTRLEGWLANVYSAIPDPYWGYTNTLGWEILADDQTPSERWRQWGWKVIPYILGEWTPNSDWEGEFWKRLPQCIREANIFIENVHPLPAQGVSAQEVEYMKAECKFMKAYYYYLLANTYGAIPFDPDYIAPTDFVLADLMKGQTPYYTVIDWADKALLEAADILPAKYTEARKYGRATSIMCLAVRARMLLFAASPLVNGNSKYADFKNDKGENVFSTTHNPQRWENAVKACKLLIDEAEKAGYKLYIEKNDDGTIDPFMSYQNLFLKRFDEGNTEILFARPSSDYSTFEKHATPTASGGSGGLGVTQSLVDAFFMQNGLPIDEPSGYYKKDGFSTQKVTLDNTAWDEEVNGGAITYENTYNMYCNREPRFYVTVAFNNSYFPTEKRLFNFFNGAVDNPHTHDAPQNGYLIRKRVSPKTNVKEDNFQYRPGIIYRLGEAYLNYAEALNEYKDDHASREEALSYVNEIRKRAGIRPYTLDAAEPMSDKIHVDDNQEAVRKAIRAERRVELCGEGIRYDDLRRWNEAENALNGDFYGMNYSGKDAASFYQLTSYQTRVYKPAYYWFPIHQSEMEKNDKLQQLPLWK